MYFSFTAFSFSFVVEFFSYNVDSFSFTMVCISSIFSFKVISIFIWTWGNCTVILAINGHYRYLKVTHVQSLWTHTSFTCIHDAFKPQGMHGPERIARPFCPYTDITGMHGTLGLYGQNLRKWIVSNKQTQNITTSGICQSQAKSEVKVWRKWLNFSKIRPKSFQTSSDPPMQGCAQEHHQEGWSLCRED